MQLFDIVANNHTLFIYDYEVIAFRFAAGTAARVIVQLWKKEEGLGTVLMREDVLNTAVQGVLDNHFQVPLKIPSKARWWVTCTSDAANTRVSGNVSGIMLDEHR